MKTQFLKLLLVLPVLFSACTDLDETYYDQTSPSNIPSEWNVASAYAHLKGAVSVFPETAPFWKLVYAVQTSTDELAIPMQQATDWYDGGIYLEMQNHAWTPDNTIIRAGWDYCYNIIANCNLLLKDFDLQAEGHAEIQTLRAYAYYRLMDMFGSVPLITEENFRDAQMPAKTSRADLFRWIEGQLTEPGLEESLSARKYAAVDRGVLNTLIARLYLNSKVFLDLDDNSTEYQAYLQKAITACDAVINSGVYTLESNVFANWFVDNGPGSKEIIFAIPYKGDGTLEGNRLHIETLAGPDPAMGLAFGSEMYTHATSGWQVNPASGITASNHDGLFDLYLANDNRRMAILYGQQYNMQKYATDGVFEKLILGTWQPTDPQNYIPGGRRTPMFLNYAPWFYNRGFDPAGYSNPIMNSPKAVGARLIKFELVENPPFYDSPTDMVVMRYAEILYTKAECLIRLDRSSEAIPLFQEVLQHRGFDPLTTPAAYTKNYPFRDMDTNTAGQPTEEKISGPALMSKRWLTGNTTDISNAYLAGVTDWLEFMDQEWRREFAFEDRRRTDMIRMGKFAGPGAATWGGKTTPTASANRNIFPIPQVIINGNPAVTQNDWQ